MSAFPDMPQVVPLALTGDDVRSVSTLLRSKARSTSLPSTALRYTRIADRLDDAAREAFLIERGVVA